MQRYVEQLIEDLEQMASQKPQEAYIEIPPQLEAAPDIGELALVPFKPISEWTGIDFEVFPELWRLSYDQCVELNRAIFKVYDSLKLLLIDRPADIPEDWLYEALVSNWDFPVQYLPSSGMDLELCSGDWKTCDYGEYCACAKDDYYDEIEEDEPPTKSLDTEDNDTSLDECPF